MDTNHPNKYQVRLLMQQRRMSRLPPPTPDEIKARLNWKLIRDAKAQA